ncbi:MAG: hypothetical protein JWP88_912 [Flaviaesturariibacter sp.]|nr:hypothetical protein [Flaviaesturariibacter sp.]
MIAETYLESVIKRFKEYKTLGDKTIEQLSSEQLLWQPNEGSNSIALIIQHLHGNMLSRWTNFLTEDGEKPWRKRDAEFELQQLTKEGMEKLWEEGWSVLLKSLHDLSCDDLLKTITIRTQPLIVIDAINRQLAHYSYHVGQIVFTGKWIKNEAWKSLSIPKGHSLQFNQQLREASKS